MFDVRGPIRAFTLIEVLLVVAIMGVVAAITVPSFARSMKGNRLRSAARTVVMAAKYSRSMCLLNQQERTMVFDLKANRISVYSKSGHDADPGEPDAEDSGDAVLGIRPGGPDPAGSQKDGATDSAGVRPPADYGRVEFERELDGVTIASVELEKSGRRKSAGRGADVTYAVPYHSNGTCTPFTVRVVDADNNAVTIRVDMLSSVETERE